MNYQTPTLFDDVPPNVRASDPDTSRAAATLSPLRRSTDRYRALETLQAHPEGLTDYELADLMGRQQNSAGKRRGELVVLGYVRDSGRRRPAPSGSKAIVWQTVEVDP